MTDEIQNVEIGNRVQSMREEKKLTQEELAVMLGYKNVENISRIENGKNSLTLKRIIQLSQIFGVTADFIIWGDKAPQNDVSALTARLGRLEPEYYKELEKIIDAYLRTIHLAEERGQDVDKKEIERDTAQ